MRQDSERWDRNICFILAIGTLIIYINKWSQNSKDLMDQNATLHVHVKAM